MSDSSRTSTSFSLKSLVFLLTVLTIVLLVGVFFFFASVSVFFQQPERELTAVTPQPTPTFPKPTFTPDDRIDEDEAVVEIVEIETAVPQLPAPTVQAVKASIQNEPEFGELIIPDIGVNQSIIPIFVRDGQWDITEIGGQIGHLETTGRYPGDQLAMTFTGHVTLPWPEIEGPFSELVFLEHGEEITYRWNGVDYIYQVERIFRADPNSVHLLYEEDGDKLILVTCSGWDVTGREYAERLVTQAVLVRQEPVAQNSE